MFLRDLFRGVGSKGTRPPVVAVGARPPGQWPLDRPIVELAPGDALTVRDCVSGIQIFGATGSGKTSGSISLLAQAMLRDGWGMLVTTTRTGEADQWVRWAASNGRAGDVLRIKADGQHHFNFLNYLNHHPVPGVSVASNIGDMVMTLAKHARPQEKASETSQFFAEAASRMVTQAIHLLRGAGEPLTLRWIGEVIRSAPNHPLELEAEHFTDSLLPTLLRTAHENGAENVDDMCGYRPVQNAELATFAAALSETGAVKIESAGSLKGGKRVWFLARGDSIWLGDRDEVKPYLLISNGHDGTMSVVCQPTTIRVVCRNTLHASLKEGERSQLAVRFRHEGEITDKLDDARRALGLFEAARSQFERQAQTLNAKELSREELQRYWLEVYAATLEPVPTHPTTSPEIRQAKLAKERLAQWAANFDMDRERIGSGATAWTALNAVTQWFDHGRRIRGTDDRSRCDQRQMGNWWGDAAFAKAKAMDLALSR